MFGKIALEILLKNYSFISVLDIGSGSGGHSKIFRNNNKEVTEIDYGNSYYNGLRTDTNYIMGDYLYIDFKRKFDCIWACHVLEHQLNINLFLEKINNDLKENGILAITVPPLKHNIVGGHVNLWNGGLLLYNLILAGFNCKEAKLLKYDYNISVILKKEKIELPKLSFDYGDIEILKDFFPDNINLNNKISNNLTLEGFNGDISIL